MFAASHQVSQQGDDPTQKLLVCVHFAREKEKHVYTSAAAKRADSHRSVCRSSQEGFISDDSTGDLLPPRPAWQSDKIWEDWLVLFICFLTYSINISPLLYLNIEFNRRSHWKNINPSYLNVFGNRDRIKDFLSSIHSSFRPSYWIVLKSRW